MKNDNKTDDDAKAIPCIHIQTHFKYYNVFFHSFSIHFISIFSLFLLLFVVIFRFHSYVLFGVFVGDLLISFQFCCRKTWKNERKMVKEMRRIIVAEKCTPGRIWPIVLCRCHEVNELCFVRFFNRSELFSLLILLRFPLQPNDNENEIGVIFMKFLIHKT